MPPTEINMTVEEKLLAVIGEMLDSDDDGDRMIGNLFLKSLRFAPEEKSCEVLRTVSTELEESLRRFDQRWMNITGE